MSLMPRCTCFDFSVAEGCQLHGKMIEVHDHPSEPELPKWMQPLANEEIMDLLKATLHGPLPKETQQRVYATLALVPELRNPKPLATFSELVEARVVKIHRLLMRHRERYVRAWTAQTGLLPSESMLVERRMDDGSVQITVERRVE